MGCFNVRNFLVLFASTATNVICQGFPFSGGVLYTEWSQVFPDTPRAIIAWVISLNSGLILAAGPLASLVVERVGYRCCYVIGALITSAAIFGSAFTEDGYQLIGVFGVIAGVGNTLCFVPAVVVCNTVFKEHRLAANAVTRSGVGIGIFVGSLLLEKLIEQYGWRGCLILYAGVTLQTLVLSHFISLPEQQPDASPNEDETKGKRETSPAQRRQSPYLLILKNDRFLTMFVAQFLWNIGSIIFVSIVSASAVESGHSETNAAYLVTILGVANVIGPVLCASLGFQRRISNFTILMSSTALSSVPIALAPILVSSYSGLSVLCVIYGLCFSTQISASTPTMAEIMPPDLLLYSFSWLVLADGGGVLSGAPLAGFIYDRINSYDVAFYVGGLLSLVSSILMLTIKLRTRCCNRRSANLNTLSKL